MKAIKDYLREMDLVSGSTGLLGMHVLYDLTAKGRHVRALFRNKNKISLVRRLFEFYDPENVEEKWSLIEWFECDILDVFQLEKAFDGVSDVYHCAATVSFRRREFSSMITTNRYGTANMVNLSIDHNVRKFCHVSSTAAVGKSVRNQNKDVVETDKWEQNPDTTGYAVSKYLSEKEVWRGVEEGLNAVIVNPCVILGPGDWNESSLTIFRAIHKGLRFYPPGANAIVDVRDVSKRMLALMDSEISSERFLIIGENITYKQLFDTIADALGKKRPTIRVNKLLMGLSWRLAAVFSLITGKPTALTKQSTKSAFSVTKYSSEKIDNWIPTAYYSVEESVENSVQFSFFS